MKALAEVAARATARIAHHEAGHTVAAVARGGTLRDVYLGSVADWSNPDSAETPGGTVHRTAWKDQPFVTFAGPWAEAMWMVENDPEVEMYEALEYVWVENGDGDTAKYESRVDELNTAASEFGFGNNVGRCWEVDWSDELSELWPVIQQVAALLIDGQTVTHDTVQAAIEGVSK
jgi:hypothetical protein